MRRINSTRTRLSRIISAAFFISNEFIMFRFYSLRGAPTISPVILPLSSNIHPMPSTIYILAWSCSNGKM